MSEDKIGNRFDSVITMLKNSNLKEPATQLKLHDRLSKIKDKVGRLIIKEFPTGTANVNTIRALLVQLRMHKQFVPDLIIVDYLELLRPNRIIDSEYMAQQRIAEELRGLATEAKCLVWTASQTNRCFLGSTNIYIIRNGIVSLTSMDKVEKGDLVDTPNGWKIVTDTHKSKAKLFRVKTKSGKDLIITDNHEIPTYIGTKTISTGLSVGDIVYAKKK